ncbi:MAG: class I SAM-dependent DNA methyltransferase [Deltaproteobacteria bacterium]|nr:class I SAM-dependent DNA methyltransferase [Deltaproteobacteria bacterium]
MPLSWNEIRSRALAFSREWEGESSEDAEAKSFWDGFFNIFGVTRRRVASFETPVKKEDGRGGYIDLLWRGVLLVEHKSRGKDLDRATRQALDYFPGLKERDLPRYVLVSDFAHFRLYDLDQDVSHGRSCADPGACDTGPSLVCEITLAELHLHIRHFGFIAGYQTRAFDPEDPVNIRAAERLGRLHDLLRVTGFDGHPLEVFLVRLLFCLFAEDTAVFERRQFQDYLENRTGVDGRDCGMHLAQLFQVLDTPPASRPNTLDDDLAAFPYVNGQLFREFLPIAAFDSKLREALLDCCALDWSRISPAVFGSLFQSIMDGKARRAAGAHYTSETNILRLIGPLFLDALKSELERVKGNRNRLAEFLKKLARLTFFDPACGCGNFLVIAYRELRKLELAALRYAHKSGQMVLDVSQLIQVNVDQFHGIELEEWPARIAEVALWLTDHQMNLAVSEEFGQYFVRLPLTKAPHIVHGNALELDWNEVVPAPHLDYLLGNPPFLGKNFQSPGQRADVARIFAGVPGCMNLDYVACWYRKAVEYIATTPHPLLEKKEGAFCSPPGSGGVWVGRAQQAREGAEAIRAAFVSTNSITQGEQVSVLWPDLLQRGLKIQFAHRTFQWDSEARGKAAVHCVIIGFGLGDMAEKWLFDYDTPKSEPHAVKVVNINPYLVDGPDVVAIKRSKPLCQVTEMVNGSKPTDGGNLLLSAMDKEQLLAVEPQAAPWIRRFSMGDEYINGIDRYCLWLKDCPPQELRRLPEVLKRVEAVRQMRLASTDSATRKDAAIPMLFQKIRQPESDYLALPRVSSERRVYIPIGFLPAGHIAGDKLHTIPHATLFHFGIVTSVMHMAWMRAVTGRLKSDYQYSATIVYNNFPWPTPTDTQQTAIETAAQAVLDARAKFPEATLADLYDPLTMPPVLLAAHHALDRAVDTAYLSSGFCRMSSAPTESQRVAFLFGRYQELVGAVKP